MKKKFNEVVHLRDLRELVDYAASHYGDKVAFRQLTPDREIEDFSFNQLKSDTRALGAALVARGFKGKHFALIGESTYSYVISYLAIANWVGVIVPIDKEVTTSDMAKLVLQSDASGLFFSDTYSRDAGTIMASCPKLSLAINTSTPAEDSTTGLAIASLLAEGYELLASGAKLDFDEQIDVDKMSTILFTSGTTGANKGVMLCHRNLVTVIHSSLSMFKLPDRTFSVLPINHSYEFNIHVLGSICGGATLCFNDSIKHVKDNLKTFQPMMSLMVPMIVEGLYKNIWKETEKNNLTQQLKYGIWFSNLLRKFGIDRRQLFFRPIHLNLGGQLRLIVCGGAPLNPALVKGFDDFGIAVYNGYGITECSPLISSNSPVYSKPGSVGTVVPDCEVRIGDQHPDGTGEIQVKGPNVMLGYYKDENATSLSFTDDGWFKTGDIGYLDRNGDVFITGRAKNLIITANGKNVHPEELEEHLMQAIPYISEVVVYAPKDSQGNDGIITATAFLDPKFTSEVGMAKARELFEADVRKANRHLATYKRIAQAFVRETEFEKTTTKKIKRNKLHEEAPKNA